MVIIQNDFEHKIHKAFRDENGRFEIIDIELPDTARFVLVNSYAPNSDCPSYFNKVVETLESLDTKNSILVGDWNIVLNFGKDTINYKKMNNTHASKTVNPLMTKQSIIGVWRRDNENVHEFTWFKKTPTKGGRLGFFLISENLLPIYSS